ncbi:hypothetical protein DV738_g5503, partial [Chaetothyriales sp. CBS 135597]
MPCFKGLAVSIHTPNGPLPEYAVQKASRLSRISTYIPVPPPTIPPNSTSNKPEPSTFAISITLLTPGQDTIAAYIYFDGRAKEEVATLLRKGEETWVNSRWVGVPESEGGGLAEREFLFREVGLERWLNGLDLEGKDAAATIQRRRQKLEKRRRKRKETTASDDEPSSATKGPRRKNTMKYGPDGELENLSDDDEDEVDSSSLNDSASSEDDDPIPEAAGQIKVALFRVLASGEIKRGEYSPQFGAHDDDEESSQNGNANGDGKADIDHTTSFAKPKTLDPKTISTQTVTGIDPTDKPYAVFTFFYRGERQLQKMGILQPKSDKPVPNDKRRSLIGEIPKLTPLKKHGAAGFSGFRDAQPGKSKREDDDMESDSDENDADILGKMEDANDAEDVRDSSLLSPEDTERTGQVAEGIRKIKLKRQHSAEPLTSNGSAEPRKTSKSGSGSPLASSSTPNINNNGPSGPSTEVAPPPPSTETAKPDEFMLGSPLKKQRSSMADFDDEFKRRLQRGLAAGIGQVLGSSPEPNATGSGLQFGDSLKTKRVDTADDDPEL